jgi:hypothetical protein
MVGYVEADVMDARTVLGQEIAPDGATFRQVESGRLRLLGKLVVHLVSGTQGIIFENERHV